MIRWARPMEVCGDGGRGPPVPRVHKLGVKRESRAAACARCAARGAQCRGTLAARPLCGAQSSCRRLRRTYDSWHRIIFIYQGHTIEERWTSIVMTVILLSSIRDGPLLISCRYARRSLSVVHATKYDTGKYASGTLASHATLGRPQPMPNCVQALVELVLAVCRCLSRMLHMGSSST